MKTYSYNLKDGREVIITISAVYGLNGQGIRRTSGYKEIAIRATVAGNDISTIGGLRTLSARDAAANPGVAAAPGPLGLNADTLAALKALIAEVQSTYADHNAAIRDRVAATDKIMASHGPGYCHRCQSYCHGDCRHA